MKNRQTSLFWRFQGKRGAAGGAPSPDGNASAPPARRRACAYEGRFERLGGEEREHLAKAGEGPFLRRNRGGDGTGVAGGRREDGDFEASGTPTPRQARRPPPTRWLPRGRTPGGPRATTPTLAPRRAFPSAQARNGAGSGRSSAAMAPAAENRSRKTTRAARSFTAACLARTPSRSTGSHAAVRSVARRASPNRVSVRSRR